MIYPLNAPLTELLLLSVISRNDSYGYIISQNLKKVSNLKDSALYPILKRLSDQDYVEIYDQQYQGRNRKYYRITALGEEHRQVLKRDWEEYSQEIEKIIQLEERNAVSEGENEDD